MKYLFVLLGVTKHCDIVIHLTNRNETSKIPFYRKRLMNSACSFSYSFMIVRLVSSPEGRTKVKDALE